MQDTGAWTGGGGSGSGSGGGSQGAMAAKGGRGPYLRVLRGSFAGNGNYTLRPGLGIKWRVISGRFYIDTDANAASRQINVYAIDDAGVAFYCLLYSPAIIANATENVSFGPGGVGFDDAGVGSVGGDTYVRQISLPFPLVDKMGLYCACAAGVAGDVVTFAVLVEEIHEMGSRR